MVAENKKAQIKDWAARYIKGFNSLLNNTGDQSEPLIKELGKALIGEIPFRKEMVSLDKLIYNVSYQNFLGLILSHHITDWDENNELVKALFSEKIPDTFIRNYWNFIFHKINNADNLSFFNKLLEQGYGEEFLLLESCTYSGNALINITKDGFSISRFGEYFKDKIEDKNSFLGLKKKKGYYDALVNAAFGGNSSDSRHNIGRGLGALLANPNRGVNFNLVFSLGVYFYLINPKLIEPHFEKFIMLHGSSGSDIKFHFVEFLLSQNAEYYGPKIVEVASKYPLRNESKVTLFSNLHKKTSIDFSKEVLQAGHEYLNRFYEDKNYFWDVRRDRVPMSVSIFDFIYKQSPAEFEKTFSEYLDKTNYLSATQIEFLDKKCGQNGVDLLAPIFQKKRKYISEKTAPFIFDFLNKYDYAAHKKTILEYLVQFATKKEQVIIAQKINGLPDIGSDGLELLKGKKVGERIIGALILSNLKAENKSPEIIEVLNEAIDTERNDATRNIMLESVSENRFSASFDVEDAKAMIEKATKRKKLNKWSEKWLEENAVEKLYWKNGEELGVEGLKFLFYRMKQTKGLQSEIEAKQLLRNLDMEKSEKLALQLLQAFIDSNSNTKIKYYLTLCGLLGSDNVLHKLHALFRKSITDKRIKMAQYVLGAIAMVGSDKALRILEVISRKYANKKPKLSAVALESLDAAAEELGITKDQLADRIIPDFGFDGIFKEFEVEGETYRAFINKEFRLVYYNENNKMRKSLPKGIETNQKKEFSAIAKEVRTIVKSQSDRLEKYMVESRAWQAEDWQTFFFNNPIMFVYAMQLLWLRKNKDGEILEVFYCDDSAEMYNLEDEELLLEDSDTISILHPLHIDEETLRLWKVKAFENDIKTIFPILERPIFRKLPEELDSNISRRFDNRDIPKGADFVAPQLVKRGWYKSTGDGGYLEFTRSIVTPKITAIPYIEGPAAWYQQNTAPAKMHTITFIGKDWRDKISIKDIPDSFYSEVMADMEFLVTTKG